MRGSSGSDSLELIAVDRDHAKGVSSNMLFMIWRFHTHANAVRPCFEIVADLAARFREGVGVCHVVDAEALPPTAAARKLISEVWRLPTVKHYSVTHEGGGFKAASVRAVVAGIHALARPRCAHSVHRSFADAAVWHAARQSEIGRTDTALQILSTFETLRARHREAYP